MLCILLQSIVQIAKVPDVVSTEAEGAGGKPIEEQFHSRIQNLS
jgi:hypothetical protein